MKRLLAIGFFAVVLGLPGVAADKTPNVSDELLAAKRELSELHTRYLDKHPRVQAQLQKIQDLERQATAQSPESVELRAARVELAELRRRYEEQLVKVADLERQTKQPATESAELQ